MVLILLWSGCKGPEKKDNNSGIKITAEGKKCMEQILQKDSILGEIRNHASENISLSETISNYTVELRSLDYKYCSEEFKSAFNDHIEAWLDIRKVSDKYHSLRGELHEIFAQLEKSEDSIEFKLLVKHVWDTWTIVEESSN